MKSECKEDFEYDFLPITFGHVQVINKYRDPFAHRWPIRCLRPFHQDAIKAIPHISSSRPSGEVQPHQNL